MKAFANLLDRLVYTPSRNAKLKLLVDYFRATPDPDRGWAVAALTDGLDGAFSARRIIGELLDGKVEPELFRLSRDYVGDTAETVALIWPEQAESDGVGEVVDLRLSTIVDLLRTTDKSELPALLEGWLNQLSSNGRWALLKLITGGLRVGVSARLAKTALAQFGNQPVAEIEEVWHGLSAPYTQLFAWLEGEAPRPNIDDMAVFRPLMLANPLEDRELASLDVRDFAAEWKWDGIRVQVSAKNGDCRIFSRTGDDISRAFPDVAEHFAAHNVVLDGELLVVRNNDVASFHDLQRRLNRKTVSKKMLTDFPAHIRLYDILIEGAEDLRAEPFGKRRQRLENWHNDKTPPRTDLSALVTFDSKEDLERQWNETRAIGIEGLMLKRLQSPYLAGRPKGHWFKWKRAPLTIDTVLMYAQRGSGKRSSFYSDYTFGTWRKTESGETELVPVGKSYSGFTDEELARLDKWVRANTTDRFGPVRAVQPHIVLEVAFDAVHKSTRHKSGVAMRFPRIHRIRWDKPANEADTLDALMALMEGP